MRNMPRGNRGRKMENVCSTYIKPCIESILPRVAATINTKKAWDMLETAYQGLEKLNTSKLQILRRYFESLSMKDTQSMELFYTRFIGMKNQPKSHGENIEEIRIPKFESLVVTLEENKDMSQFTIDELQASLISHAYRISKSNTYLEGAFAT